MRKILVLRGGALGDFLVTLPALALIRKKWPTARVELAGNAPAAALALECRLLDAVHSQHEARWAALFGQGPLPAEFTATLASFDLVVNFWPDADGNLRRKFPLRAGQTFLQGEAHPKLAPAAAHFCEPLRALGLGPAQFDFRLRDSDADSQIVAIHPGSGSATKNWPLDRWAALAEWLTREQRRELVVITGEAEAPAAHALERFGRAARHLPLSQLADVLARCRVFIGHDSGVSHLAAACSARCVLLFGPTDPTIWAPPSPHVTVLRESAGLGAISVATVQRGVLAALVDRE